MKNQIMSYNEVQNIVFNAINRFEGTLESGINEYSVISLEHFAFMLLLRREDVINPRFCILHAKTPECFIEQAISSSTSQNKEILNQLLEVYKEKFSKMSIYIFYDLCNRLNGIERSLLDTYLVRLFDEEISQSHDIHKLIAALSHTTLNTTVYNPYANYANLVSELKVANYYGQSTDDAWALGSMRLMAYHLNPANFRREDSINSWNSWNLKYDFISATALLGKQTGYEEFERAYSNILESNPTIKSVASHFIIKGIEALTENGKLIALIYPTVLYNNEELNMRKLLVENDLLEMVIQLPANFINDKNIPAVILVVNMNKQHKGHVILVNAQNYIDKSIKSKFLFEQLVFDIESKEVCDNIRMVSNEEIIENGFNLNISRYFIAKLTISAGYKTVTLDKLLSVYKNVDLDGNVTIGSFVNEGKYLSGKDLKNDAFNYKLLNQDIQSIQLEDLFVKKIESDILLMSLDGKLNTTWCYASKESPIYFRNNNIEAFLVDENEIVLDYLVYQLSLEYVQKQMLAYSEFLNGLRKIRLEDLLKVNILLPSLDEQRGIVEGAKESALMGRAKELNLEKIIDKMKQQYLEEIRMRKHSLAQPLFSTKEGLESLLNHMTKTGGINTLDIINQKHKITLEQHIKNMQVSIAQMASLLNELTEIYSFDQPELVDLGIFIKEYFEANHSNQFEFRLDIDKDVFNHFGLEPKTLIAKKNLTDIFDNIVQNAINHGFVDQKREDFLIWILLSFDFENDCIQLRIRNNGKPLPVGMDNKRYFMRGEKGGVTGNTGIGGNLIKLIVEHFGGEVTILGNNQAEFPVEINLNLKKQ